MEQKFKIIIVGLVVALIAALFLFVQAHGGKQQLIRERDELKSENANLITKMDRLSGTMRNYEARMGSLSADLEKISREKTDLEKKYELVNRAREELLEKLKSQKQQLKSVEREQPAQISVPQSNDAYWAAILKEKTDLEMQLSNVRNELKDLQIGNEQLQREKANFELELNNLKRERDDLSRQLDYNKRLLDTMAQDLVREKNDKAAIQDSYKSIRNENSVLSRQLSSLNTRKANLERKLQDLNEDKQSLEGRLSEMETMLTEKLVHFDDFKNKVENVKAGGKPAAEPSVKNGKNSVDLPEIVVKPKSGKEKQEGQGSAPLGRVMAVNKENNFIIIDLGAQSGVKTGDAFTVYRNDKAIASIEVIQIRQNISACDIKTQSSQIRIGDTVR